MTQAQSRDPDVASGSETASAPEPTGSKAPAPCPRLEGQSPNNKRQRSPTPEGIAAPDPPSATFSWADRALTSIAPIDESHPFKSHPPTEEMMRRAKEIIRFWGAPISRIDHPYDDYYTWKRSGSGFTLDTKFRLWANCSTVEFKEIYGNEPFAHHTYRLPPRTYLDEVEDKAEYFNRLKRNQVRPGRRDLLKHSMNEEDVQRERLRAQALYPEQFHYREFEDNPEAPRQMRRLAKPNTRGRFSYCDQKELLPELQLKEGETDYSQHYPKGLEMDLSKPIYMPKGPRYISRDSTNTSAKVVVLPDRKGDICPGCGSTSHSENSCRIERESYVPLAITKEEVGFILAQSRPRTPEFRVVCKYCGSRLHRGAECQRFKENDISCAYPLCPNRKGDHLTPLCKTLHNRCKNCNVRGHSKDLKICEHQTLDSFRQLFNAYQPAGLYTRLATQSIGGVRPMIGWGFYPVRGPRETMDPNKRPYNLQHLDAMPVPMAIKITMTEGELPTDLRELLRKTERQLHPPAESAPKKMKLERTSSKGPGKRSRSQGGQGPKGSTGAKPKQSGANKDDPQPSTSSGAKSGKKRSKPSPQAKQHPREGSERRGQRSPSPPSKKGAAKSKGSSRKGRRK